MSVGIVDYGVGNLASIVNMLKKLKVDAYLIDSGKQLEKAQSYILPGVGAFDYAMSQLNAWPYLALLKSQVLERRKPLLGICLGMQLLMNNSEEGVLPGLSLIPGRVKKFVRPPKSDIRIPHMGWNIVQAQREHPLLDNEFNELRYYFVHSYHVECEDSQHVLATTPYINSFASVIAKDNIMGVQFHPEKSHQFGLQLLHQFVELSLCCV